MAVFSIDRVFHPPGYGVGEHPAARQVPGIVNRPATLLARGRENGKASNRAVNTVRKSLNHAEAKVNSTEKVARRGASTAALGPIWTPATGRPGRALAAPLILAALRPFLVFSRLSILRGYYHPRRSRLSIGHHDHPSIVATT
ncbi:hypothetical protein VTN02DRAFT_4093 [Thermoascus thermophilus]